MGDGAFPTVRLAVAFTDRLATGQMVDTPAARFAQARLGKIGGGKSPSLKRLKKIVESGERDLIDRVERGEITIKDAIEELKNRPPAYQTMHMSQSPTVRLAHQPGSECDNVLIGQRGVKQLSEDDDGLAGPQQQLPPPTAPLAAGVGPPLAFAKGLASREKMPALLVSYVYLKGFIENRHRYAFRDWVLDSGAFSAHMSGTVIDLQAYIDKAKELRDADPQLTEIFSLDVIGDWRESLKNAEEMWRQGVEAIPTYHIGEPEDVLKGLARDYPKIALGGVAVLKPKVKNKFAEQCFARVWPKKIHGFGYGDRKAIMAYPWHSVDATNWEMGPCAFARWNTFGNMSVRGSSQNLRAEVEFYLELEYQARLKWKPAWDVFDEGGASAKREVGI